MEEESRIKDPHTLIIKNQMKLKKKSIATINPSSIFFFFLELERNI